MPDLIAPHPLFLTGAPGVGKSTAGLTLAKSLPRCLFLDLDDFREQMVSGLAQPSSGWRHETSLQFDTAHIAIGCVAKTYHEAGIQVIIAHCSNVDHARLFLRNCPEATVVCLSAELEVNLTRNNERANKNFDPRDIAFFVHDLHAVLPAQFRQAGFPVLDTTYQSLDETVNQLRTWLERPL